MEIASNKGVIADASTPAGRAGMSESEWREAIKFDSTDTGWVIMSIGMAIGAGIVFLPVQVGLMGLWVFLLSSVIASGILPVGTPLICTVGRPFSTRKLAISVAPVKSSAITPILIMISLPVE